MNGPIFGPKSRALAEIDLFIWSNAGFVIYFVPLRSDGHPQSPLQRQATPGGLKLWQQDPVQRHRLQQEELPALLLKLKEDLRPPGEDALVFRFSYFFPITKFLPLVTLSEAFVRSPLPPILIT